MEIATFAEIEQEFNARITRMVWCNVATVDAEGTPRSRVLHPIWEGTTGWIATRKTPLKVNHLAHNPRVSMAYIAEPIQPVYVDGTAEWVDDRATKARIWDFFKNTPPPLGYDPVPFFNSIDEPNFSLLKITPTRIEIADMTGKPKVWHSKR